LGDEIVRAVPGVEVELIAGGKGDFIVKSDGVELWNKKQMGNQFPDEQAIVKRLAT
jgi:predicted Rdx family selenoprotein